MTALDLTDARQLVRQLVDIPSVSGQERVLADSVEAALSGCHHLSVRRDGDAVVARTTLGRGRRVLLAGHLDTVQIAGNVPARLEGERLFGCGTSDMKSGLAVMLHLAALLTAPRHDLTWVFYDQEEVEASRSGLGRLVRNDPAALAADLAILLEPTDAIVEAGCQGTIRVEVSVPGVRAHSARSWLGDNAVHRAAELIARLTALEVREPVVEGVRYHEGLNVVRIEGGVAGNVIPDRCAVTINYRFAPDRSETEALDHVRQLVAPYDVTVLDSAAGARPGLDRDLVTEFAAATGRPVRAKFGWTDVARFTALGIPALNYGPGDPALAHRRDEYVDLARVDECVASLGGWLVGG